jgi:hypothetical protein
VMNSVLPRMLMYQKVRRVHREFVSDLEISIA